MTWAVISVSLYRCVRRITGFMILISLYEKFTSDEHVRKVVIETFIDEIRRGSKPQGSHCSSAYREAISSAIVYTLWSCHVGFFLSLAFTNALIIRHRHSVRRNSDLKSFNLLPIKKHRSRVILCAMTKRGSLNLRVPTTRVVRSPRITHQESR